MTEADENQHHFEKRDLEFEEKISHITRSFVALAAGDVDGDGKIDLIGANDYSSTSVTLMVGNGSGQFTEAGTFIVVSSYGTQATGVALADFNNDNNLDIAISITYPSTNYGNDGTLSILLGNGASAFGTANNIALNAPNSIAVADFNNDGNLDITTSLKNNQVSVLLGDGAGNFGVPSNFAAGLTPVSVAVADFNKDGHLDIATANTLSQDKSSFGGASVLLGDGTGNFGTANTFIVGISPKSIAVGDFNRDGNLDIVTANSESNNVSVLLGDGNGTFEDANNFAVGLTPYAVAVADFDDDGNLDIATNNVMGNNISILLGNGKGTFKRANNFAAASRPTTMITADVNNDNKNDIIVSGGGAGNIYALINQALDQSSSTPKLTMATTSSAFTSSTYSPDVSMQTTPINPPSKTHKLTSNSSSQPSTTPMSNGTLALLMMAPVGGLLLLMMVFGAFFYRRYQIKIEKNEQYKDLPMLPMKQKSNDSKIELLVDNEEYRSEIDAEMQDETIETDSQGQKIPEQFAKKQQFFKSNQLEDGTATVQSTQCIIS